MELINNINGQIIDRMLAKKDDPDYRERMRKRLFEIHRDATRTRDDDIIYIIQTERLFRPSLTRVAMYISYQQLRNIAAENEWVMMDKYDGMIPFINQLGQVKAVYYIGCGYATFFSRKS